MTRRGNLFCRLAIWPAVALSLALVGCARWDLRGEGFDDDSPKWNAGMRPAGPAGESTALTRKGAEIDRDLGVR